LNLDDSLDIILQQLCEEILKFRTTEIFQNFLPIRRRLKTEKEKQKQKKKKKMKKCIFFRWRRQRTYTKATQIGLKVIGQDLQSSGFTNTVRTNKTKNVTRTRHGKSMELERVGTVTVSSL
jgi:hypothetical protein